MPKFLYRIQNAQNCTAMLNFEARAFSLDLPVLTYSHNFLSRKRLRQIQVFYMEYFLISLRNQIPQPMKKIPLLVICLFLLRTAFPQVSIDHVEPPSWWTGMKNNSLQLLIHGKDIGKTKAFLEYKGVKVKNSSSTGADYLFVDLEVGNSTKPGTITINFKENEKDSALLTYRYELNARAKESAKRQGFNTSDMMYLIMPDRFANGDPNNDDMPGMLEKADRTNPNGRHGGDIKGIADNLGYLEKLGVTTIAITSTSFADKISKDHPSRHPTGANLYQSVDIFINNHLPFGDAILSIEGCEQNVGPTSTYCNCFTVNYLVMETCKYLVSKGYVPPVFRSGNMPGGDEYNKHLVEKYSGKAILLF